MRNRTFTYTRRTFLAGALFSGAVNADITSPLRIITLGDSITKAARPGVTEAQTFSSLLKTWLNRDGYLVDVFNRGIVGERTDQALLRLETILTRKPDIITVMYGTNDSYVDLGQTESRLTLEQFRNNLRELVRRIREVSAVPVLMTPPCWAKGAKNGLGEDPNIRLSPFVKAVREVAEDTKAPLVDHWDEWMCALILGEDVGSWTTDLCHPNPAGQERLAKRMLPVVRRSLRRR